jgi:putative ABC transport system permease protein
MVLIESAWIAALAALIGSLFAAWSAPFVVSLIKPPDNPARLILPADGRVLGFGIALTLFVTCFFGVFPALRASAINPSSELKGGDDPHSRRRIMHTLVAVQVAFCFLVLFVAGLFVTTFQHLSHLNVGFNPDRILVLSTVTPKPQPAVAWQQVANHLASVPGVQSVTLCDTTLLGGNNSNNYIAIPGSAPIEVLAYFRRISPGWFDQLQIPLLFGRDFTPTDSGTKTAIVNEAFAKTYFAGQNPVGKTFEIASDEGGRDPFVVVGLSRDATYRDIRELHLPTVFMPFWQNRFSADPETISDATFLVRTANSNPLTLAQTLRAEIPNARSEFRVSNISSQLELIQAQTVRERLLAMLAFFFAAVALLLASIGLYGVLHYSVLQRRREIGIRMAVGAQPIDIARRVTSDIFFIILAGAAAGLILGIFSAHSLASLFYQVKPSDLAMLTIPALTIFSAALLSSLPAVISAVRTDPVTILRTD